MDETTVCAGDDGAAPIAVSVTSEVTPIAASVVARAAVTIAITGGGDEGPGELIGGVATRDAGCNDTIRDCPLFSSLELCGVGVSVITPMEV
jgi:hypothetical protein